MIQCTDQASHFSINYEGSNMSLTNFIDQMDSFPSLSDCNVDALKWTDLDQDVFYQITSTCAVDTQHGQFCLSRKLMDKAVVLGLVVRYRKSCYKIQ